MTDQRLVAGWLNDLATLTAGTAPIADSKAKVAAMTDMLATEFPTAAFTRDSLQHVARTCTFFPSYAEVVRAIAAWWRDNRPAAGPALAGPTARLNSDDQACLTVWLRRRAAGTIPDVVTSLSMLRDHKAPVFAYLVATDAQCRRIANQRGWLAGRDPPENVVPLRSDAAD